MWVFHYVPGCLDLITHTYDRNLPESIIDYSDALRFKFKRTGIHDNIMLMSILSKHTDIDVMAELKRRFNSVGMKGINTSTVKILREESNRSHAHRQWNSSRYHTMEFVIGVDATMETFPRANTLLHHNVVSSVAINQNRHKPNRWVNKITYKLIDVGITSIKQLQTRIDLNDIIELFDDHDMPRLHAVTIIGFAHVPGTTDFCQGQS
jgi:hypothetical protein